MVAAARKVAGNNGTNTWQVALMAGALILSVGTGLLTLLNPRDDIKQVKQDLASEITKNEREIEQMRNMLRDTAADILKADVPIREHEEFKLRLDQRAMALDDAIKTLRTDQVTRSEHQQHWAEIDARINSLRDGLNELRHDYSANFTVGDALKRLQTEIDNLRTPSPAIPQPLLTQPLAPK
jgi:chromosome segregation ATPase